MHALFALTADYSTGTSTPSGVPTAIGLLIELPLIILMLVSMWKVFTKAGEAGWKSIIPIYNSIVLLKIAGKPWWWLLLFMIPFVNIYFTIVYSIDLAKAFGKSTTFGVIGLALFGIVGFPMLAFGSAQYVGPDGAANADGPQPQPGMTPPTAPPTAPVVPTPTV